MCEDVEEEEEEEEEEKKEKRKKKYKKEHECFKLYFTYQSSNHLMQYIPHHIHTSMFTSFKSSALFISTAVTQQYSCQK